MPALLMIPKPFRGSYLQILKLPGVALLKIRAEEKNQNIKVVRFPWSASGRAASKGTSNGLTKLILDPETGSILGGGVAGKDAGVLIAEISLAIEMAATAKDLALTIHPHPTLSETIMESAELYEGSATHLPFKKTKH